MQALAISRALFHAADLYRGGKKISEVQSALAQKLQPLEVEYAELCDAENLAVLRDGEPRPREVVIAVAAFVDGVRLIDNVLLK